MNHNEARKYIRSIRNASKRLYAEHYWRYLTGAQIIRPTHGTLSVMAAQAVRMQFAELGFTDPMLKEAE